MELQITPNKQSRRNWLRDAAIVTTSVTVAPSFFIGCTDHRIDPGNGSLGGSLGSEPTLEELQMAAKNLNNMRVWLEKLYGKQVEYENNMYHFIKGGKERPSSWTDFITNIVLDIVVGIIGAAAAAAETVTEGAVSAGIVALIALTTELVKKFTSEDVGGNFEGVIAEFMEGQRKLYEKLDNALIVMGSDNDNYKNLKEAFKGGAIEFNGKKYTLSDLAKADFPTIEPVVHNGEVFVALQDAAMLQFKKYFWNAMIAKAGKMIIYRTGNNAACRYSHCKTAYEIVRNIYINEPARVASYMRGYFQPEKFIVHNQEYVFAEFYFEIDGKRLSADVAEILFIDTVRGNDINPTGLFHRDYVYKQFHLQKPDFQGFHEIARSWDKENGAYELNFDEADDNYEFTGGLLKSLTKPK